MERPTLSSQPHTPTLDERDGRAIPGPLARIRLRQPGRVVAPLGLVLAGLAVLVVVAPIAFPNIVPVTGPPSWSTSPPPSPSPSPSSNGSGGTACYRYGSPTPSSVLVPTGGPGQDVGTGGAIGAQVEFGALTLARSAVGATIDVPTLVAAFPATGGPSVQVGFVPRTFTVPAAGWIPASIANRWVAEPNGLGLAHPGTVVLSSQKIAVETSAAYGSVTLEVRWRWTLLEPNGSVTTGPWTVPTNASQWPTSVPSEFYPAPYVAVLSTNGPTTAVGTEFVAHLGGVVASRYFFLELESPTTGKVSQDAGQSAPPGATSANASILLLNYDRYLYPGTYLVHIHDSCGALLVSLSVQAAYSRTAAIGVTVEPAACGKITFNGTGYGNGATISTRPSSTSYSFQLPGCAGHTFHAWKFTGGLYPNATGQLLVSASGTVTVQYT